MENSFVNRKLIAIGFIFLIGAILLIAVYKFLGAFVGAFILFTLFNPLYLRLTEKSKLKSSLSAVIIILITLFIVLIPLFLIGSFAINEVIELSNDQNLFDFVKQSTISLNESYPHLNLSEKVDEVINGSITYLQKLMLPLIESVLRIILNIFLMYFILYFMLTDSLKWKEKSYELLPFNDKNSQTFLSEFKKITNSTIIGFGIIGVIQGILVGLSLWIVGIKGAIIWGIISTFLSFIPILGPPVVWIPAAIYILVTKKIIIGVLFIVFHVIITMNIDNILRPIINRKIANIHPLTSMLGVFFGIYLFGIMGIILGPLLISYFFLSIKMYEEEYSIVSKKPLKESVLKEI